MKRIVLFISIILCIFTINSLIHSIFRLWQKQDVVVRTEQELKKVQKENRELSQKSKEVNDPKFLEEQARNKLFVAKPGEEVVILPSQSIAQEETKEKSNVVKKAHWQEWVELFWKEKS